MDGVLDALELTACVVDREGVLVATNRRWRRFCDEHGGDRARCCEGASYLGVCAGAGDAVALAVADGLRDVLTGRRPSFGLDYACLPGLGPGSRWHVAVTPYRDGAVVAHQDVSHRVRDVHRVSALRELATRIASGASLDEVFTDAARHACVLLGAAGAAVVRHDGGVAATVLATWSAGGRTLPPGTPIELTAGEAAGLAAAARGATRRRHPPGAPTTATQLGYRSSIVAPVLVDERVWGMVVAGWPQPDVRREAVEVLEALAELAAIAVGREQDRLALARQAATDPLTGLANRRAFHDRLEQEVARARRHGRPVSVALVDVDRFKAVNDREGHAEGDHVLCGVAEALRTVSRAADLPARLGGDEFVVVLPEVDDEGAFAFAERVRAAVAALPPLPSGTPVSVSVGVAALEPGLDATQLLHHADRALYAAKTLGRSRACAWSGL